MLREIGNPHDELLVKEATARSAAFRRKEDLHHLVEQISSAKVVMLGESSHGTHEFYEWRRLISLELIRKHDFQFIAVEGDWPPCWQLNNFVQGRAGRNASITLGNFSRWPTWMWANLEIITLAQELLEFNKHAALEKKVSFYGLDVYSLFESIDATLEEVAKVSPFLERRLKSRYECFDPYARDEISYAKSLLKLPAGCHEAVLKNLQDILDQRLQSVSYNSPAGDSLFNAEQNARTVANAENYYRAMVSGSDDSWNVRERHMLETLEILLDRHVPKAKAIVWAHNTHIGDYRATDMLEQGQVNIGGLAREKWGAENIALVGFGTYQGDVIASPAWHGTTEKVELPLGAEGSYESAFHKVAQVIGPNFWLSLKGAEHIAALTETRGHRAVGVVYHPAYERLGNYVPTSLAKRYDHFLFFDRTTALKPLIQAFDRHEFPETYPQGM
jgi:erythromycin esterase